MLNANPLQARPTLLTAPSLTAALGDLAAQAGSPAEIWRLLTERYVVDLDAVAMLMPIERPEPLWLSPRN